MTKYTKISGNSNIEYYSTLCNVPTYYNILDIINIDSHVRYF